MQQDHQSPANGQRDTDVAACIFKSTAQRYGKLRKHTGFGTQSHSGQQWTGGM
jgi:hypothetical protein